MQDKTNKQNQTLRKLCILAVLNMLYFLSIFNLNVSMCQSVQAAACFVNTAILCY